MKAIWERRHVRGRKSATWVCFLFKGCLPACRGNGRAVFTRPINLHGAQCACQPVPTINFRGGFLHGGPIIAEVQPAQIRTNTSALHVVWFTSTSGPHLWNTREEHRHKIFFYDVGPNAIAISVLRAHAGNSLLLISAYAVRLWAKVSGRTSVSPYRGHPRAKTIQGHGQ